MTRYNPKILKIGSNNAIDITTALNVFPDRDTNSLNGDKVQSTQLTRIN